MILDRVHSFTSQRLNVIPVQNQLTADGTAANCTAPIVLGKKGIELRLGNRLNYCRISLLRTPT